MKRALLVALLVACRADPCAAEPRAQVRVPVRSASAAQIDAVPSADRGAVVKDFASAFPSRRLRPRDGFASVEVGREPVYILDGDTTVRARASAESSPFGFHPALDLGARGPFAAAREIGIRWHRGLYAYWVLIQPEQEDIDRGVFHWEQNDREWGAVPRSMAILANIGLPERVGAERGARGRSPFRSDWRLNQPEEKYLAFVRAVVERYDGDGKDDMPGLRVPIRHWQVENEPDMGENRDWEGFAHLQEITYRAIKEACPETTVLLAGQTGGGTAVFDRFYAPLLRKLGGRSVDVYDIHHYGDAKLDWLGVRKVYDHVRRTLDALGYGKTEVWITEMGSYSGSPGDEGPRPDPRRRGLPTQTEREQARDVVKRHVFPLAIGAKKVFWAWGLIEGFKHDDGYFDHTGLIYDGEFDDDPPRGTRKLAYYAYRKMTETLDGADWSRAELLDLGKDVYAVRVPRGQGTVTTVWHDPPYRLSDIYAPEDLARLRRALEALGPEPTTRENLRERLRAARDLALAALEIGGPGLVEDWAPRDEMAATVRKVRESAPDAAQEVDGLIGRARAKFQEK